VPYFRAPPALVHAVQARAAAVASARDRPLDGRWRGWLASAAAGCAATLVAVWVATSWTSWRAGEDLALEAVDAHVRATLAHHLVEVASSDQHTVKPWLSARLDFSPAVRDFAAEGFTLAGARLDYLGRRGVAALVYRYRDHVVDVFVRPTPDLATGKAEATVRGFNVVRATGGGMDWMAVSDASPDVLAALLARLAAGPSPP
jgi:anti-sigma factor RsiW